MKEITMQDGTKMYRVSRWIKIRQNYNVSPRNHLYYYATDENGYRTGSTNFKHSSETFLDYFRFGNQTYAINQFLRLTYPIFYETEDGKLAYLSGYDAEDYYNPLMIELSDDCEYVRLYSERKW